MKNNKIIKGKYLTSLIKQGQSFLDLPWVQDLESNLFDVWEARDLSFHGSEEGKRHSSETSVGSSSLAKKSEVF